VSPSSFTSRTTAQFWKEFARLPEQIQRTAAEAYERWLRDPHHPGLQFKRVHSRRELYSVRVGEGWRAVGLRKDERIYWFWIGSHAEYDRLLRSL